MRRYLEMNVTTMRLGWIAGLLIGIMLHNVWVDDGKQCFRAVCDLQRISCRRARGMQGQVLSLANIIPPSARRKSDDHTYSFRLAPIVCSAESESSSAESFGSSGDCKNDNSNDAVLVPILSRTYQSSSTGYNRTTERCLSLLLLYTGHENDDDSEHVLALCTGKSPLKERSDIGSDRRASVGRRSGP